MCARCADGAAICVVASDIVSPERTPVCRPYSVLAPFLCVLLFLFCIFLIVVGVSLSLRRLITGIDPRDSVSLDTSRGSSRMPSLGRRQH